MVIVDGNNVMGQRVGWHRNKSAARQRLMREVEALAHSKKDPLILVFDGKKESALSSRTPHPLISIQFSRKGATADELILELVYEHLKNSTVTVVTSDRALTRQIQILGANVMRSGAFRKILDELS